MKVAYSAYQEFLGQNLDDRLQPLPDRSSYNYKYAAKQTIDSLGLRNLLRTGKVLLIRKEYEISYQELRSLKGGEDGSGCHWSTRRC